MRYEMIKIVHGLKYEILKPKHIWVLKYNNNTLDLCFFVCAKSISSYAQQA